MSFQAEWKKSIDEQEAAFRKNIAYYGLTKTLVYKNDQEGYHWELHCKCCPKGVQDSSMNPIDRHAIACILVSGALIVMIFHYVFNNNLPARW